MGQLRKMARNKKDAQITNGQIKRVFDSKKAFDAGYKMGFSEGAKDQRETDHRILNDVLNSLEQIPGIGVKSSEKIRDYFKEYWRINNEKRN